MCRDTARSFRDVARAPYHQTLWTYGHLLAEARREGLVRRGESVGESVRLSKAFNDPAKLAVDITEYEDAIGLRESSEDAVSKSARLLALVEQANQAARAAAGAAG